MVELTYLSLKKTTFFCSYFRHISLCFYSNFDQESSLDVEFDSASNQYPHCIILTDPATPKTRNTWKMWWWCHHHIFSSKVCSVGTRWMRNQILHPTSSPDQNLSKNTGRYVENMNTKSNFFLSSSKINQYYFIILTIILLFPLGGPF